VRAVENDLIGFGFIDSQPDLNFRGDPFLEDAKIQSINSIYYLTLSIVKYYIELID